MCSKTRNIGSYQQVLQTRQAFLPDMHPETRLAHLYKGGGGRHRLGKMFVFQREVERGNSCLEQRLSCDPRLRLGPSFRLSASPSQTITPSHSPTSTLQLPCPLLHAVEFPISIRKRPDGKVEVARKVPEGLGTHACVTAKGGGWGWGGEALQMCCCCSLLL